MKGYNKEIISLIEDRLEKGKREYNQEVDILDGREWLTEALEEVLHPSVYLSAEILKMREQGGMNE